MRSCSAKGCTATWEIERVRTAQGTFEVCPVHRALLDEAGEINPFPTLMPIQAEKAPKGGRAPVPLTPETKTKIVTLRAEGASLREIQAATGVRRSTLGRRLNAGLASAPEPPPPDPALSGALARVAAASKRIEEGETKLREGERMITDAHAQIQATHLAMAQLWVPKGTQGTRSLAPLASPRPQGGVTPPPRTQTSRCSAIWPR